MCACSMIQSNQNNIEESKTVERIGRLFKRNIREKLCCLIGQKTHDVRVVKQNVATK